MSDSVARESPFAVGDPSGVVASCPSVSIGKYVTYRPSGLAWLGVIPSHWRTKPLRFACRLNSTKGEVSSLPEDTDVSFVPMEAVHEYGGMSLDQTRMIGDVLQGYTYFRDGDIVAAKITPCFENGKGSIAEGLTNGLGFGTTELHTLRPGREFDTRFLFYLTLSHEFRHQGAGHMYGAGGQKRVPESFLRDFVAPLPPVPEQEAIAAWLDERTRRVDELVAAKRRLIDLLAEQRTALITHAVTKGLNPDAPMKPAGIAPPRWLGDVPRHWEVKQLKFAATFQRGHDLPLDDRIVGDVPIVTSAGPSAWHNQPAAHGPAIVTGRYGTVGEFFLIEGPYWPLNTTLYTINLRGNEPRYLWYMLQALKGVFLMEAGKSAVPGVDRNDLHPIPVVVPPLDEQQAIVAHLDAACTKLDSLIAAAAAAITRLTEYRQALISAAVTGKINVCGAASTVQPDAASASDPVIAGRINGKAGGTGRTANKYFQRSVLAAEIIARIGNDRTFGRVKLQKALILAEGHLQLAEIESQPMRAAAGPFDNAMMRSIQSQLQKSQWYEYRKDGDPLKFLPLAKAGGHKQYFDRYWGAKEAAFAALMDLLAKLDTQRSEIVATLYSAWNDFLIDQKPVTDDALVAEVLTNWDPAKTAIPEDKWRKAIGWMRGKGLVPTGYGAHTRIAQHDRSKE